MKIRPLTRKDIRVCSEIVGKNYSKKWQKTAALELAAMFSDVPIRPKYLVAEEKRQILGFAGYTQSWMDYGIYQIFWVNVAPDRQRQGIGKRLVAKIISDIKKRKGAYLIQLAATPENAVYYKRHFGFKTNVSKLGPSQYNVMSLTIDHAAR